MLHKYMPLQRYISASLLLSPDSSNHPRLSFHGLGFVKRLTSLVLLRIGPLILFAVLI